MFCLHRLHTKMIIFGGILGQTKHIININHAYFSSVFFFNVATREFEIASGTCAVFLLDTTGLHGGTLSMLNFLTRTETWSWKKTSLFLENTR